HRLVGMHVRDLNAEDFVGYRTMSSGAFGGGSDPTSPDAPRDFSPRQTALGIDSSSLPGGLDGVVAAGARIRHDLLALGGGVAHGGGIAGLEVRPAHCGDGLFGALLFAGIARCGVEGMTLSMRKFSNVELYRRYG